ncbi:hypothetical protein ASA1KI_05410 [Opitutales bacterium ASA1]|uniref:hypothetical protein n=1 Tax=Congregicoccus parvus TaxID=3081749 RepID=UPI002B2D9843|nr:hypothetical protein ASA1KI_05410 [Opitutales bacterium ASA1]
MNPIHPSARILFSFALFPFVVFEAQARRGDEPEPIVWPEAKEHRTLREGITVRTMTGDEVWGADTLRHQILDTGAGTRTVTLSPIGVGGIEPGAVIVARVEAAVNARVLFRRADGELLAFWGGDSVACARWIVLKATDNGWETRVSEGRELGPNDPGLEWSGTRLQWKNGYALPAGLRTDGWVIRFETDASLFFVRSASGARFRVVSDGSCIADVELGGTNGTDVRVPIDLGSASLRRIELVAERLEFGAVESPDDRILLATKSVGRPTGRVLWLGEDRDGAGTRGVPWLSGSLLGLDVWNRSWSSAVNVRSVAEETQMQMLEEIGSVSADAVFLGLHPIADELEGRELTDAVGSWFDAVSAAVKPGAVVLVLTEPTPEGVNERAWERRTGTLEKEAKRRGFRFVDWREWQRPARDGTVASKAALAGKLAQEFRRLGLDREVQTLALQRARESRGAGVGGIAATPPVR